MMRTCKKVLHCIRILRKEGKWYPNFSEISHKSGLHPEDVQGACSILEKQGFIQYGYPIVNGEASPLPGCVFLTLKGKKPVEYAASQFREYLKGNWIAILALIVSFIALLQSLGIISLLSKEDADQKSGQRCEQTDFGK